VGVAEPSRRVVADGPAGGLEPPDEVDVLTRLKVRVEPLIDRLRANQERGGRDTADSGHRTDVSGAGPHFERGVASLVGADEATGLGGPEHPEGDGGDERVGEVAEEGMGSPGRHGHVGVDESANGVSVARRPLLRVALGPWGWLSPMRWASVVVQTRRRLQRQS
jgi:hypothetical protein